MIIKICKKISNFVRKRFLRNTLWNINLKFSSWFWHCDETYYFVKLGETCYTVKQIPNKVRISLQL